jgi:hypothetical protein
MNLNPLFCWQTWDKLLFSIFYLNKYNILAIFQFNRCELQIKFQFIRTNFSNPKIIEYSIRSKALDYKLLKIYNLFKQLIR